MDLARGLGRIAFSLMLCLMAVVVAMAQADPEEEPPGIGSAQPTGRFVGGIVAGLNLSQIDGDQLSGFNQLGLNAGLSVSAVLAPRWQLGLEMLFSQQGSNRNLGDPPSATIEKIRLNMVEVPVMVRFLEWKFHVNAGLSYARVINFTVEDILGEDISEQQDYRSNLLFVRVGATYFFTPKIGLNLGWNKSLIDLEADSGAGTLLGRNIYIRGVYLF